MAVAYWDTSCVLKLYCFEEDSAKSLQLVEESSEPLLSSALLVSELAFAFPQKELRGEIKRGSAAILYETFLDDVAKGRFTLIPLGEDVQIEARAIADLAYGHKPPISLRTLDGLHLASARLAGCREIHTTDARIRAAAAILGFAA
jgi:predicted nucleic acid-binding protein